jgi:hypothetical protein
MLINHIQIDTELYYFAFKVANVQTAHHQHQIPNLFLKCLCTSVTFSVFQQYWRIHLCFLNVNCDNAIFFYTEYCHLAECVNKVMDSCHLASYYYITAEYCNLSLFIWELWASKRCIHFWGTLCINPPATYTEICNKVWETKHGTDTTQHYALLYALHTSN